MAQCNSCGKKVGCSCSLKEGLCLDCRQAMQKRDLELQQQTTKVNVTIKIPKQDA